VSIKEGDINPKTGGNYLEIDNVQPLPAGFTNPFETVPATAIQIQNDIANAAAFAENPAPETDPAPF
jgi:hypothetical protein